MIFGKSLQKIYSTSQNTVTARKNIVRGTTLQVLINDNNSNSNKWSKSFDIRPHRRCTRTVQPYSTGGANVHPIYRKPKNGCHSNVP